MSSYNRKELSKDYVLKKQRRLDDMLVFLSSGRQFSYRQMEESTDVLREGKNLRARAPGMLVFEKQMPFSLSFLLLLHSRFSLPFAM
jgi:hypothetical protein